MLQTDKTINQYDVFENDPEFLVYATNAWYKVHRGSLFGHSDYLIVTDGNGNVVASTNVGPGSFLHPHSAQEARQRPWFYTGSPFGAHIVGFMWERHAELSRA